MATIEALAQSHGPKKDSLVTFYASEGDPGETAHDFLGRCMCWYLALVHSSGNSPSYSIVITRMYLMDKQASLVLCVPHFFLRSPPHHHLVSGRVKLSLFLSLCLSSGLRFFQFISLSSSISWIWLLIIIFIAFLLISSYILRLLHIPSSFFLWTTEYAVA